jgi:putative DNA primase/helicase
LAREFWSAARIWKRIWLSGRSERLMGGGKPAVCEPPQWDNIPPELTALPQWVLWRWESRKGKWTKAPYQPDGTHAKADDPVTWSQYEYVETAFLTSGTFSGVGFVLTADDPFVAWDFDRCLDGEANITDPRVVDYVTRLNSYTEISPSGTGLRVLARGKLPRGRRAAGNYECYDTGRYVTITGNIWPRA